MDVVKTLLKQFTAVWAAVARRAERVCGFCSSRDLSRSFHWLTHLQFESVNSFSSRLEEVGMKICLLSDLLTTWHTPARFISYSLDRLVVLFMKWNHPGDETESTVEDKCNVKSEAAARDLLLTMRGILMSDFLSGLTQCWFQACVGL